MTTQEIEQLVEQFFEGATTLEQERQLYDFFRGDQLPDSLEQYRAAFQYFDHQLSLEAETIVVNLPAKRPVKRWIITLSAAACLTILVALPFWFSEEKPYEGSYIIRDGVRIENPKIIEAELLKIETRVNSQIEQLDKLIEQTDQQFEQYADLDEAYITKISLTVKDSEIIETKLAMIEARADRKIEQLDKLIEQTDRQFEQYADLDDYCIAKENVKIKNHEISEGKSSTIETRADSMIEQLDKFLEQTDRQFKQSTDLI